VTKIRIRLLWHPQAQFAGYLVAQRLGLGASAGITFECVAMRRDQPGMAALAAGDVEMAVASPGHLLKAAEPQALRFILAIQQKSSLCYPVLRTSGIAELSGLAGRTVGVWPGNEDLEFRWMLHKAGIAQDAVTRVPMIETVDHFLRGEVASAQMTTYHELYKVIERTGENALTLFHAESYGADLLKDGLFVHRDWLAANREVAEAAVAAILEGWTIAFTEPDRTVAICSEFRPDMPLAEHREQLEGIRDISIAGATVRHGLGYPDPEHVVRVAQAIRDLGGHVPQVDPGVIADASPWRTAPQAWRATRWARG
jgi:ABC-type nitrate/sulfonate/bicarbonate transport system substrate-binding protein